MDPTPLYDSPVATAAVAAIAALAGAVVGALLTNRSAERTAKANREHLSSEAQLEREHAAKQASLERHHGSELAQADRLAAKRQQAYYEFGRWAQSHIDDADRQFAAEGGREEPQIPDDATLDAIAPSIRLLGSRETVKALDDLRSLLWDCREQGHFDWDDEDRFRVLRRSIEDSMRRDLWISPIG